MQQCMVCKRRGQLLTVEEVARYLRLNKFTIYRLARDGKIPAFKIGKTWRFRKDMLDKWLQTHLNCEEYKEVLHDQYRDFDETGCWEMGSLQEEHPLRREGTD